MASTIVCILLLGFLVFFVVPGLSTSRGTVQPKRGHENGFMITLKHVDSGKNLTKFQRIQRAMQRGHHRLQRLNAVSLAASDQDDITSSVAAPLHAGNGEFLMDLAIGTPAESYSAIVDTGSDLIWTQCKPCTQCFDQPTPIFDPKKSSSFKKLPCSNKFCEALPQSTCRKNGCEYLYTYGDYSSTHGRMAYETFTFGSSNDDKIPVKGVVFGCGGDNQGDGFTQGGGLIGLGRGPLSLVSQLKESKFSYCLTSIDDDTKTSKLLMGSLASMNTTSSSEIMITTPIFKNPSQSSFYYLNLEGISIGGKRLPIKKSTFSLQDDGTGGLIIDSGTTITYLEQSAFDLVKDEFSSQVKLSLDDSGTTGLDLCFKLPSGTTKLEVPKFVFHFEGADLELPGENYVIGDSSLGVLCLAMGASNGMSILGNMQQQNMMVIHDLAHEKLSFVPTKCDQL